MGVKDAFSNVGRAFGESMTQEHRATEQAISNQKSGAILRAHNAGLEAATQYGGIDTPEGQQAYATIATQAGMPTEMVQQVQSLAVNPRVAQYRQMLSAATLTKMNTNSRTGRPNSAVLQQQIESQNGLTAPQDQQDQQDQQGPQAPQGWPSGEEPFVTTGVLGNLGNIVTSLPAGSVQRNLSATPGTFNPPASNSATLGNPPQPAERKSSWRNLFGGKGTGKAIAGQPEIATDGITGKPIPELAVTADTTPTTMKDIGIENSTDAEQFQTLEAMVGKSLPDGFDLRTDYAKNPDFYVKLFKAIRDGVPDQRSGKRRKLSTQEILDLIAGE
jgi:hypothetical protein